MTLTNTTGIPGTNQSLPDTYSEWIGANALRAYAPTVRNIGSELAQFNESRVFFPSTDYGEPLVTTKFELMDSTTDQLPAPQASESATDERNVEAISEVDRHLRQLHSAMRRADEATDSDHGMWEALCGFLRDTTQDGVVALSVAIGKGDFPESTAAFMLRTVGLVDPRPVRDELAFWMLKRAMRLPSPVVRDGALVGLMNLDDSRAGPVIENAARTERDPVLRADMLEAVKQWV